MAKVEKALVPNESGFYSIPADGGAYWTFGTSDGKYGEFAKWKDAFFSVNKGGYVWAKSGTDKGVMFVEMIKDLAAQMVAKHQEGCEEEETSDDFDD